MSDTLDLQTSYRAILGAARERRFISYGDLAKANGAEWQKVRHAMNHHLGELVGIATDRGWPMPSAIVVNKSNVDTGVLDGEARSEEHTSELQSLMRISYAVFCLKKTKPLKSTHLFDTSIPLYYT